MGYHITFDSSKIKNAFKDNQFRTYAHERLYAYSDPYVPFRTGALSKNVRRNADGVHYLQDYANKCFYGNFRFRKDHHPKATGHWVYVMMANDGESYIEDLSRYIKARL